MNTTKKHPPVPFNRSYWVVPGKFLAGSYPGSENTDRADKKLRNLIHCGIRHVISLMQQNEIACYGLPLEYFERMESIAEKLGVSVTYDQFSIEDMNVPGKQKMIDILDRIDTCIGSDKPVFIHCWGGRGRTGTVVGCYLVRHGIATGEQVLEKIRTLRENTLNADFPSPMTREQAQMVVNWKEGM